MPAAVRERPAPPALDPCLYDAVQGETWEEIPHCRPLDHTMAYALDEYVSQKLPTQLIFETLLRGRSIEIHGIYPEHFPALAGRLGFEEWHEIGCSCSSKQRPFNFVRPRYFEARRAGGAPTLVIAVTPGKDYVRHYAGLVRHFVYLHTRNAEETVSILRYPAAEEEIARWTQLGDVTAAGELVVVGYVEEVRQHLQDSLAFRPLGERENGFYSSCRYVLPGGKVINLLGVKFSFWGSIGAQLSQAFCATGVEQILYVGKLGALSSPADVYTRIFCPSRFVVMSHQQVLDRFDSPPNPFLARFPELDTQCHISVPTVLEEDYAQRQVASGLAASSIDNEISQMARAVKLFNQSHATRIGFTALHFATDYIRNASERHIDVPLNLSNNRTRVARGRRQAILDTICRGYLLPYLSEWS